MALFLGLFITKYYGIQFTFLFFILSDILPSLIGGESIKGPSIIFWIWYFIVNSIVLFFSNINLLILGPILVVIESIGSIIIHSYFGFPGIMAIGISLISVIVRIIYFLTLGRLLEQLFKVIV
jgi:hypothetical protein